LYKISGLFLGLSRFSVLAKVIAGRMKGHRNKFIATLPLLFGLEALAAIVVWWSRPSRGGNSNFGFRVPTLGARRRKRRGESVLAGKLIPGAGRSADLPGDWPQFRGPNRDGISSDSSNLSPPIGTRPRRASLWAIDVGEGYAGVAIRNGGVSSARLRPRPQAKRVAAMSSLADVPGNLALCIIRSSSSAITGIDAHCAGRDGQIRRRTGLESATCFASMRQTGALRWSISLVRDFARRCRSWYAGQCPLVDGDKVILAPAARDALLLAVGPRKPASRFGNAESARLEDDSLVCVSRWTSRAGDFTSIALAWRGGRGYEGWRAALGNQRLENQHRQPCHRRCRWRAGESFSPADTTPAV
jgi:hypothetical protein